MKNKLIILAAAMLLSGFISATSTSPALSAGKVSFADIYLGGPDPGTEGNKIITQFLAMLSKYSGIRQGTIQGQYFNNISSAKVYLRNNRDSFIIGSIGFFLANRKSMNLVPLATVKIHSNDKEQYYMLIKKGKYQTLKQMKGKIISGNVLYEDPKFINKMIFNNIINVQTFFTTKPTYRALSAVRKVDAGKYDAVLLNNMQYHSLKNLAVFKNLQVVHKSPQFPALGLMMVNTKRNQEVMGKIMKAVTEICYKEDGKSVCKNFAIGGFKKINQDLLNNEIKRFEGSH
jgi:ABC-type phosphate/phosphonate transport system substrate-binding protein